MGQSCPDLLSKGLVSTIGDPSFRAADPMVYHADHDPVKGKKTAEQHPVTFYNDNDSLFAQAEEGLHGKLRLATPDTPIR
jgi:hypothetical protein